MEALRKDNWKVVRHLAGEPIELYDLDQDAGEIVDLAERYPDRTTQMAELLSNAQTDGPVILNLKCQLANAIDKVNQ